MRKIKSLFRLLRFELPFSAGICVVMGQLLALGKFASVPETAFGFFSMFFISASILVLNDYFDVETDKINSPERPIPSGLVTSSETLVLSMVLLVIGLGLSVLLGIIALLCSFLLFIIGYFYNSVYKKTGLPGNIMVSFSVGMTFIYGGISVGLPFNKIVLLFSLIAALIDLGEEIAADSVDISGDRLINSKSLAIKYGQEKAIKVSVSIFSMVVPLTLFPFLMNWFSAEYLIAFILMDTVILYSSVKLLKANCSGKRRYLRWIYLGSTAGLIVFILMRLLNL